MYNIRTNVLLDKSTYQILKDKAALTKESMSSLIRKAVNSYYQENELKKRQKIMERIKKSRVKIKGKIDYKALIEDGRKY